MGLFRKKSDEELRLELEQLKAKNKAVMERKNLEASVKTERRKAYTQKYSGAIKGARSVGKGLKRFGANADRISGNLQTIDPLGINAPSTNRRKKRDSGIFDMF